MIEDRLAAEPQNKSNATTLSWRRIAADRAAYNQRNQAWLEAKRLERMSPNWTGGT